MCRIPRGTGHKGDVTASAFQNIKKKSECSDGYSVSGERVRMAVSAISSRSNIASMEIQCEICII